MRPPSLPAPLEQLTHPKAKWYLHPAGTVRKALLGCSWLCWKCRRQLSVGGCCWNTQLHRSHSDVADNERELTRPIGTAGSPRWPSSCWPLRRAASTETPSGPFPSGFPSVLTHSRQHQREAGVFHSCRVSRG